MIKNSSQSELVKSISNYATQTLDKASISVFNDFVAQFLINYSLDAWQDRRVEDLYACCLNLWYELQVPPKRLANPKIKIYTPNIEEHRWQCGRTVITVLQKDMPFLVDSIRLNLQKNNVLIHTIKSTVLEVERKKNNVGDVQVKYVGNGAKANKSAQCEALIYLEISLQPDKKEQESIKRGLKNVLGVVAQVVKDYGTMLNELQAVKDNLTQQHTYKGNKQNTQVSLDFLSWLTQSHFSFLGFRDFSLKTQKKGDQLIEDTEKRLGVFKSISEKMDESKAAVGVSNAINDFYHSDQAISFSKSATRSSVHRNVYPDYIVIKKYNKGKVVGEYRFLGLFTYSVFNVSPFNIPIVAEKVSAVMERSGVDPLSHSGKNIRRVIENFPREELFQSSAELLCQHVLAIADINERHVVRLIIRKDPFGHFVNCLVYVPRDVFSTRIRKKIETIIGGYLKSNECDSTTYFSESTLARVHLVFKTNNAFSNDIDINKIESDITEVTQNWEDSLQISLIDHYGERAGVKHYNEYRQAFSPGYQENFDSRNAVHDISMAESLASINDIGMNFYRSISDSDNIIRFKLMRLENPIELSDIIPILENLGLRVLGERPYKIIRSTQPMVWLHEFELQYGALKDVNVEKVRALFEDAFLAIWNNKTISDSFNKLVLGGQLNWREVSLLRAYAAYMKQTLFSASTDYIASALACNIAITKNLILLFKYYFDPNHPQRDTQNYVGGLNELITKIKHQLEAVTSLNEDTVLRRYLELFEGTLRTNFFQLTDQNEPKEYIAIKFKPSSIIDIPEPKPEYEIFVFSPDIEGVHLRGGKVARGGLRWSDRHEDYRTEVLGLVKAQQVKNAVIVPHGAKGGFVAKKTPANASRDEALHYGISCYKTFIRALLDITDNIVNDKIIPPKNVVRRDEDDPYLVVAADKGTATFSDIANDISLQYKHWLGDAFASGGSQGYDHKGMGITAKGAWVSVQRHFREKGLDVQSEPFSVVGIGDMAGDVFGNGMLLSDQIKLVAAFNHLHIFIDPTPDTTVSFAERKRLFELPRSSWQDYNKKLISKGGGIFMRDAKSITLTPQMQSAFQIDKQKLTPTQLISEILKAPVDLIWNGGIGTYVKSSAQTHAQVGDKANDGLRVNGKDLRCKVFGEGGNLGMSQLGRIEFALNGGACYTDFIDNAAGVDCSDHEVNIKILLDKMMVNGDMTQKQRNKLLADMTDAVSELVLKNNYRQSFAISLAHFQINRRINEYRRFISSMESQGKLNRALEYLPTDEEICDRQNHGKTLTKPELSVLISYAKVSLKETLIASDITEDPYIVNEIETAFPNKLNKKYKDAVHSHKLLNEIVGTQIANDLINNLGITAAQRLIEATGTAVSDMAKAYVASRDIFELNRFQDYLKTLDNKMPAEFQAELMLKMVRRVRRGTRWFLRNRRAGLNVGEQIANFKAGLESVNKISEVVATGQTQIDWNTRKQYYLDKGVPNEWSIRLAMPDNLFSGLCVVEASRCANTDTQQATEIFYLLLDKLQLNRFAEQVSNIKVESYWQAIARESFIDDLEAQVRRFIVAFVRLKDNREWNVVFELWENQFTFLLNRWRSMITEVQGNESTDYALFSVAIRELIDLAQATIHCESL